MAIERLKTLPGKENSIGKGSEVGTLTLLFSENEKGASVVIIFPHSIRSTPIDYIFCGEDQAEELENGRANDLRF